MLASLAARRGRAVWAFLAVALGVGVATALAALSLEVGDDLARSLRASGPNFVVMPPGASWPLDLGGASFSPSRAGLTLTTDDVPMLKTSFWKNNVLSAAPELGVPARIGDRSVTLLGTWFDHPLSIGDETWPAGIGPLHPMWRIEGRWPADDAPELALGARLAAELDLQPGRTVAVAAGGHSERWRVTAVVHTGGTEDARAWAPLSHAQRFAGRVGEVDRIWMSVMVLPTPATAAPDPARDPVGYEKFECTAYPANVARSLSDQVGGAEVLPMSERVEAEGQVVRRLGLLMVLLALAALTAASLGLFSTTTAAVVERRSELALLRSLGASPRALAALLLGETSLVALAAGASGWLLGTLAAALIRAQSFGTAHPPQLLLLPLALLFALGVAAVGTIGPLRIALRLDPATVLRG